MPAPTELEVLHDKRLRVVEPLRDKISALQKIADNYCADTSRQYEDILSEDAILLRDKGLILEQVAKQITKSLDAFLETPDARRKNWNQLQTDIFSALLKVRTVEAEIKLATHRAPLSRWLKEIGMLIATLFVGSLAITAWNAIQAETGTFTWNDIGFFSKTASQQYVEGIYDDISAMIEAGEALETEVAAAPRT